MTSNITVSKDLFDVANADDGEKLELARIGLIDLSVRELLNIVRREDLSLAQLLDIVQRGREAMERQRRAVVQTIRMESNPWRRAALEAKLARADKLCAERMRLFILGGKRCSKTKSTKRNAGL
jgi:hypothetical protein